MAEYLVRLAPEIATKARRTRKRFVRVLVKNMRDCLRSSGIDHTIDDRWSRLFVTADDETTGRRIAGVFGVSSVSTVDDTGALPALALSLSPKPTFSTTVSHGNNAVC